MVPSGRLICGRDGQQAGLGLGLGLGVDRRRRRMPAGRLCDISVTGAWGRIDGSVTAAESPRGGREVTHNHQLDELFCGSNFDFQRTSTIIT